MKIVQILHNYSVGDGMSDVAKTLSEELQNQGHDVTILYRKSSRGPFKSRVPAKQMSFLEMLSFAKKTHVDVVHTHFGKGAMYGSLIKLLTGKKHIFTYHALAPTQMGTTQRFRLNFLLHRIIFKLNLIDRYTAISNFVKRELKSWYGINSTLIYDGVNTAHFKKSRSKTYAKGKSKSEIYVGCIGAFDINKNQSLLIEMLENLPDNVKLILGGSGSMKEKCETLANSIGVRDRVIFTGFVSEENKVDFYNACDIFAFPSLWEGFGLPVVEAMSCEKPTIVMNNASLPELIRFGGGYVASTKQEFVQKIKLLLNEKLRVRLGKDARDAVVQNFNIQKQAKRYIQLTNY